MITETTDPTDPPEVMITAGVAALRQIPRLYDDQDYETAVVDILTAVLAVDPVRASLATVRALISPEAGMAHALYGQRYFAEADIRAALEVTE